MCIILTYQSCLVLDQVGLCLKDRTPHCILFGCHTPVLQVSSSSPTVVAPHSLYFIHVLCSRSVTSIQSISLTFSAQAVLLTVPPKVSSVVTCFHLASPIDCHLLDWPSSPTWPKIVPLLRPNLPGWGRPRLTPASSGEAVRNVSSCFLHGPLFHFLPILPNHQHFYPLCEH